MKKSVQAFLLIVAWASWIYFERTQIAEPFYELSLVHIRIFRESIIQMPAIDKFLDFCAVFGGPIGLGGVVQLSCAIQNTAHGFILGLVCFMCLGWSMMLKMYIREPRPLFLDANIPITDCEEMDFGNPSIHSMGISAMMFCSVYLLHRHFSATQKWDYKTSVIRGVVGYNFALIVIYFIAFSRVLKGVHSYNQIISGIVQGSFLTLMVIIFYDDLFMFYLDLKYTSFWKLIRSPVSLVF